MFVAATHVGVVPVVHVSAHASRSAGSKPSPPALQVSIAWLKQLFVFATHIEGASIAPSISSPPPTHLPLMLPECGPYSSPVGHDWFGTAQRPSGSLQLPPGAH